MSMLASAAAASAPTGQPSWLTPVWDAPSLALAAALLGGYAVGVRRVSRQGLAWPWARTVTWTLGLVSLLALTTSGVAAQAHVLLWVFTVQVLGLLLVTPMLLAYGRPVALAADALAPPLAARVVGTTGARWVRVLTSPAVGPLLVPLVLSAIYFTPVLPAALQHEWAAQLLQLGVLAVGLVLALGLVGTGAEHDASLAVGAAVAVGLLEFLTDAVPGIVVRLQTHVLAPVEWAGRHRPWGPPPLADQQHAGALLWFVAEAADLPFLVILIRRWIRADERDAAAADRLLDAADGARRAQPVVGPPAADLAQPVTDRPWWETDASRLAGHRLAREYPSDNHG